MGRPRPFLRAFLGLAVVAAACSRADHGSPLEPSGTAPSTLLRDLQSAALLQCLPLTAGSFSVEIGAKGGTLQVGPHTLEIPRGALNQPVKITGEIISDRVNSVRFQPEGLRFKRDAHLTLSYHNCPVAATLPMKRVALTTEGLSLLMLLPSVDKPGQKAVTASLEHFSRYAIAY